MIITFDGFSPVGPSGSFIFTADPTIIAIDPDKLYYGGGLKLIGNLRTTTEFTTTTSLVWEKTGTRTSVSAGKRKLKMQSVGRSTTTTLNVNTNVNCDVRSQQSFSQWRLLKQRKILFFKPCS